MLLLQYNSVFVDMRKASLFPMIISDIISFLFCPSWHKFNCYIFNMWMRHYLSNPVTVCDQGFLFSNNCKVLHICAGKTFPCPTLLQFVEQCWPSGQRGVTSGGVDDERRGVTLGRLGVGAPRRDATRRWGDATTSLTRTNGRGRHCWQISQMFAITRTLNFDPVRPMVDTDRRT
jgi:hypothetical protein